MLSLLLGLAFLSPAHADEPGCKLPDEPAEFLSLVSRDRTVSAKEGEPGFTLDGMNFKTFQANLPRLLSSCRMTPVEITGEDPLTHEPRAVNVLSYVKKGMDPANLRTVLLLPPTGGQNALDDYYANELCDEGARVVLVQHWLNDTLNEHDFGSHDRGAMRAVAAIEDVVEYIHPKKPSQLGILGTSVGAITAALILGVDARISTGVLIVGGGGMGEIIGTSTEAHLAQLRKERMADPVMNLATEEDYVKAASASVKIEPLTVASFARHKKMLHFIATRDVTVPTDSQYRLYRAFGSQELVTHDDDHFGTIKYTSFHSKGRVTDFLLQNLQEAAPSDVAPVPQGNKLCRNAAPAIP